MTSPPESAIEHPQQIFLNTVAVVLTRLGGMAVALFLTPILVNSLGTELFGLWTVTLSISAYLGLLDFGFGAAFVKYIAEYVARGERDRARQVVTFGFLFYLALGLVLAPAFVPLIPSIIRILKLSAQYEVLGSHLLIVTYIYFFLSSAFGVLPALLAGLGRLRVASWVAFGGQIVYATAAVLLLHNGLGVTAVVIALYLQLALTSIALYGIGRSSLGGVFHRPRRTDGFVVGRLLRFGGWMQINNFSRLVNMELDRFLIATFVGVSVVTYYEIGNRLSLLTQAFPMSFLSALLPAASALSGKGHHDRLERAYVRSSRYLAGLTFPIAGFLAAAAAPLAQVWMGRPVPQIVPIMALLVTIYTVNNLTGVGTTMVRAQGVPQLETRYAVLGMALNLTATLLLAPRFGLMGILAGTFIGSTLASIYFVVLFHRRQGLNLTGDFLGWLWRIALPTALAGTALGLGLHQLPGEFFAARIRGLGVLAAAGLLYLAFWLILLRLTRFMGSEDLRFLRETVPRRLSTLLDWRPVRCWFGTD